jgi:hypothetical protein
MPRKDCAADLGRGSGFHKGRNAEDAEMTTELSTNTTPARGLALATFDDAIRFAQMVAKSEFAPKDFRGKPESCMLAIQHGSEIGLSPMQSLQNIACINGRPAIWGDAALAIVQASAVCEFVYEEVTGEGDAMAAVCQAKRRGYAKPTTATFTVADAKRAGLWGKTGPWTQYPKRMLQLRARGFALRDAFPDVLKGLVTAEEAQDYPTTPATPEPVVVRPKFDTPPQPAEERADPFELAQAAIEAERDIAKLDRIRAKIELRLKDGTFAPFQADSLFDQIHARVEFLEAESEVVA